MLWLFQIIHDINDLATEVCGDYLQHVLQLLSSCSSDVLDLVRHSILQGGKSLTDLIPLVINTIVETLVEKSVEAFLRGERATTYLTSEVKKDLLDSAAKEITNRYYELAADLVSVARKTESSLQRIRQGAQRRAGASSEISDHNVSDTYKICQQLKLDIQEYGCNLKELGVDPENISAYRSLLECVSQSKA